jgi:hypothetical protein
MRKLFGCVAFLGLAACAAQPAPLGPPIVVPSGPGMSASEVREVVVGNTGTGAMSGSLAEYSMFAAPDGSAQVKLPSGIDQGAWRLTDDGELCLKWRRFRAAQEYCQRMYKDALAYKLVNSNSVELLTFVPGKRF